MPVGNERKALALVEYEVVLPRVLELIASGSTLSNAIGELSIKVDSGGFLRWLNKDPVRLSMYKEAKEIRSETWAGKLVEYAEGVGTGNVPEDVQRSKLKVDTLKWLMAADNRRTYGEVKQVELGGSISITAALAAAQERVIIGEVVNDDKGEDE